MRLFLPQLSGVFQTLRFSLAGWSNASTSHSCESTEPQKAMTLSAFLHELSVWKLLLPGVKMLPWSWHMQVPLLLQWMLMNIHGVAVQSSLPTPQIGYWPRGLGLSSPAPQKITPWLPCQTLIALIKSWASSITLWSFILVLLTFFKCFISCLSGFIFMKDSNFFEFLSLTAEAQSLHLHR